MSAHETFSASLRSEADAIWAQQHAHPFVRGIGDGTVDPQAFARYVRQDYLFLVDYARLLALGAARAPDVTTMRRFADLTQAILGEEMELHRAFAAEIGVSAEELAAERPDPLTRAYTDFLLRTATLGDVAELAAALLPCMWGYAEIGRRLAASVGADGTGRAHLDRWIATYADPGFAELGAWCRDLVDRLAQDAGPAARERMVAAFLESSRLELAFWDVGGMMR
ncbi:thiaminase II [Paraconexibacter sp.]|uniref:thiaminase II n=1 Tax=Paraconexibacter sp. TaxID=2949640 RepID=UPI003562D414